MTKKRVLIVDYEPKLLDRLQSQLPADQFEVATAQDGFAALEVFESFHPDLVFLRTMLPKKHGFQVCQEMVERSGSRRVPIVMHCSIYKSRKYRNDAMKIYGAAEYLEDPISPETLQSVMKELLDKQPSAPAPAAKATGLPDLAMPSPSKASKPKGSTGFDVDKTIEDTLSGINLGLKKSKKPSMEETVPIGDFSSPEPPPPPPPAAPPPEAPQVGEQGVTSEELFGEVIHDVIEPGQASQPSAAESSSTAGAPAAAPPPPPLQASTAPPRRMPVVDVNAALGERLLTAPKGEDTAVRRLKARSQSELDRKLEETLSGVKLGAREGIRPTPPAPAPVEAKAAPVAPVPAPESLREEAKPAPTPEAAKTAAPEPPKEKAAAGEEGIPYGQYMLMERIAVGGMAELFKARQNGLEGFKRIVAIKRILPHLAANQEFVTMFIDEAKLAAQLNHPNIGHIYDLGKLEDSYFIAMEYVEGKDLRAIMREIEERKRLMPIRVATFIAQKVCSALQYAHQARDMDGKPMDIVHRDVSPQNIIISTSGEVKLVDFGIAKAASKASHTVSGALKGKLLYMSPEQAWGKTVDRRGDIFSLGIVMAEMLTGKKLFYGDSEMSILEKVREAKVVPPKESRPEVPDALQRIILRALQRDPERRYRDCKAMQAELEKFAYGEWETLPSAYDAAAFLTDIFPEVYRREILEVLKREPEETAEAAADGGAEAAEKAEAAARAKAPKSERGKYAPGKKERARSAEQQAPPEAAKPAASKPVVPAPAPKPAPPPPPPPPTPPPAPKQEERAPEMFGSMVEEKSGKKNLLLFGGIAAALLVVAVVALFVITGKKKPAEASPSPPAAPPAAAATSAQTATKPVEVPPPVIEAPKPAPPPAAAPPATDAQLASAKRSATRTLGELANGIAALEKGNAAKYAAASLDSLKRSQANLSDSLRRAKTVEEYQAVQEGGQKALPLINQVRDQVNQAKAAEAVQAAEAAQKAEQEQAAQKAAEAAQKAQEAAKTQPAASASKVKAGDFVQLWAVDVKPRIVNSIQAQYTSLARANRVQGTIYVQAQIDETGRVTSAQVVRGPQPDYGLDEECVKAALKSRYSPAIKDGVPVKTSITYPVVFKIGQ
ncbi:MAG: TonB family protein [Acidobacteriota bacterium]